MNMLIAIFLIAIHLGGNQTYFSQRFVNTSVSFYTPLYPPSMGDFLNFVHWSNSPLRRAQWGVAGNFLHQDTKTIASFYFSENTYGGQSAAEVKPILQKALKNDPTAFTSEYLQDAFSSWQKYFKLKSFHIDTTLQNKEYLEAHVRFPGTNGQNPYAAVLLISNGKKGKIVDVRKNISAVLRTGKPEEQEIIEFIERLAWIYDTGQESFLMDLLFPDYIKMQYEGIADKKMILEKLHQRFSQQLPISGFSWEKKEPQYLLALVLDSPLKPLTIAIDIQKHGTARFFDFADKRERTAALLDSMRAWQSTDNSYSPGNEMVFLGETAEKAIRNALDQLFSAYMLQIERTDAEKWRVQAGLIGIAGFIPAELNFELVAFQNGQGRFTIQTVWMDEDNLVKQFHSDNQIKLNGKSTYAKLLSQTIQRYATLALSKTFQPEFNSSQNFAGKIFLHSPHAADSIGWTDKHGFKKILTGLARDKIVSFYPGKTEIAEKGLWVTGQAVFQDTQHLWHHIAKIREQYILKDKTFSLRSIEIDLHPFIRMENVKDVFADEEPLTREPAGIPVRRR